MTFRDRNALPPSPLPSDLDAAFHTPANKRNHNRRLFTTIADRYDLITVLLSFGRDAAWKRRLLREAAVQPHERVLDLACGTGDLTYGAARAGARAVGIDLTYRMVQLAHTKSADAPPHRASPSFVVADMTFLPVQGASFDAVTVGYGLRNVPELDTAIAEIFRVLRPGGRVFSLDFNRPQSTVVRGLYLSYLTTVGSALGWLLHRDPDTYRYIPASIRRYPGAQGVAARLTAHGFTSVRVIPLLSGLMTLHLARRPA